MKRLLFWALILGAGISENSWASHRFLCCDAVANKVCVVSEDGKVEWEYAARHPQDCWKLPNGNYLFCFSTGALELKPDKTPVWEYKAPEKTEVHACQPLENGNVMIMECGSSRIIEVDRSGKIAKEIKLQTLPTISVHDQFRGTRKIKNGHYLVCFKGEHKVVEVDGAGASVREVPVPGDPHEVLLKENGNWLISCGDGHRVVEVDPSGKTVWELTENEVPENPLRLMAGMQRLPNGNTVFCNYLGHGHLGKQPMIFELTPEKKVAWQFADHTNFKSINQVQLLDASGDATRGEIKR
jgi:hypothetical protein